MLPIYRMNGKAFRMFDLKRENKVISFIKYNPELVLMIAGMVLSSALPEAQASGLNFLENKLKQKIGDVATVVKIGAGSVAAVSFFWLVAGFFKGEPNYRLCGSLIVGGGLLALGSQIVGWMVG